MVTHFVWCHLFIVELEWGMLGAALGTNLTYLSNMILTDFVIYRSSTFDRTRAPLFSSSLFSNWWDYLRIGIPGACMLCFEWWAFEFLAVFSGYMGVAQLAAEVVIINIVAFLFMMPLGISFAASALTGIYIGQRNIPMAKRFAQMAMLLNFLLITVVLAMMFIFHEELSRVFSTDPEIVETVESVLWIIIIYVFFDSIHGVQAGIIRGIGR